MPNQGLEQKEEAFDEERRRRRGRDSKGEPKIEVYSSLKSEQKANVIKRIKIPIIRLEGADVEIKEVKVDKEVPKISEVEVKVDIPVIVLQKPKIELKKVELDCTSPDIMPEKGELNVQLIRLDKPKEVRCLITTFDERLPQVSPPVKQGLRVPIYRVSKPVVRDLISTFDGRIDTQILQRLTTKEKETEIEIQVEEKISEVVSTESEPGGGGDKETPDVVDLIFGISNGRLSSRGPKIVLYKELEKDSTIGSFETLCIRIYREKVGGYPKFKPIKELDEFNIREIEKWMEAHGSLFTIDLDCNKKRVKEWFSQENLREPIRRAIVGDIGFIIFKTRDKELYEHCKKVLEKLEKEVEHPLDVVYLEPRPLSFEEKKELSSLVWGCLNLDQIPSVFVNEKGVERPYGATFDDIFNKYAQREFEERLEKLKESAYSMATKPHESEESYEHKRMKWFVVRYLTKELIRKGVLKPKNPKKPKKYEINEIIKTEEDTKEFLRGKVVADVMDISNSEVYEIETLFAQDRGGKTVEEKIICTIEKYKELTYVKKINIILDNFTVLRHLKTLIDVRENEPKEERERVEFYTLDLENKRLIPLEEVKRRLKNLQAKIKQKGGG